MQTGISYWGAWARKPYNPFYRKWEDQKHRRDLAVGKLLLDYWIVSCHIVSTSLIVFVYRSIVDWWIFCHPLICVVYWCRVWTLSNCASYHMFFTNSFLKNRWNKFHRARLWSDCHWYPYWWEIQWDNLRTCITCKTSLLSSYRCCPWGRNQNCNCNI